MNDKEKRVILIVEDEPHIVNFLTARFKKEDMSVFSAATVNEGLRQYQSALPDVVILDLGLPDRDGMDFIHLIRKQSATPIIVLSARDREGDKVDALDAGANDYVTKPFGADELMARVRNVLRTADRYMHSPPKESQQETFGTLTIHYDSKQVFVDSREIHLTKTEYLILEALSKNAGRLMTYEEIIDLVWNWLDESSIKKLQVNMSNIRRKIGEKPGESSFIANELGLGYRMEIQ